jgi:hypothetical protein
VKTVSVTRDYQFNGGARRRYGILYRAGTIYTEVREPIAAELEREGAGTIVGLVERREPEPSP